MKHLILASILLPSLLMAQPPQPIPVRPQPQRFAQAPADALPDNYQVTLNIADKDGQPVEVSVVVASTEFNASMSELNLTFSGNVTVDEAGSILIAYALSWQTQIVTSNNNDPTPMAPGTGNIRYQSSEAQGSVRLKLGEEAQIIRAGTRTARLSIKKLEMTKAK
jgi:hypothetical protein